MAELNLPMNQSAGRRLGSAAVSVPRLLMSWEDWLTFAFALIAFLAVSASIQQADWVDHMPKVVPTVGAGLLAGLFASRRAATRFRADPGARSSRGALGERVELLDDLAFAEGAVESTGDRACAIDGEEPGFGLQAPRFEGKKKTANAVFKKVVLNEKVIHENAEVLKGVTGGSLSGSEAAVGPLMLQGDHGPVAFRNVRITPKK